MRLRRTRYRRLIKPLNILAVLFFFTCTLVAEGAGQTPTGSPEPGPNGEEPAYQTTMLFPLFFGGPLMPGYDMVAFMVGDGRLYEVQHSSGSQARHQTQFEGTSFYHTKGNEYSAEWEELWASATTIYRGTDTSPGNGQYYTLRDPGMYGSAWAPRFWTVGDVFRRLPLVTFYQKSDCAPVMGGYQESWLRFEAYYPNYTFASGITLANVVELAWLPSPTGEPLESYFYAQQFGLVGWQSSSQGLSYVSELHEPGTRPDNTREVIPCLNRSPMQPGPQIFGDLEWLRGLPVLRQDQP
jgi:hypothetical protein